MDYNEHITSLIDELQKKNGSIDTLIADIRKADASAKRKQEVFREELDNTLLDSMVDYIDEYYPTNDIATDVISDIAYKHLKNFRAEIESLFNKDSKRIESIEELKNFFENFKY